MAVTTSAGKPSAQPKKKSRVLKRVAKHWQLYSLLSIPLLYLTVFHYWPMVGAQIAFRNYNGVDGIWGSAWVGWANFQRFFASFEFDRVMRNTFTLSLYSLVAGFPFPIMLALGLNYVTRRWFKYSVQMVAYAPHFISMVVLVGMILQILAPNIGIINHLRSSLGLEQISFMSKPAHFPHIYVWSGIWQNVGFGCIIYLAALSSVDPTLHEAAIIDGASKVQRMWFIDLPEIMPLAVVLLVLSLGNILSTGFEKILLMQNPLNARASDVIDTYVYQVGLESTIPNYSYATAIGLFKGVIGMVLVLIVNNIANRFGNRGLF